MRPLVRIDEDEMIAVFLRGEFASDRWEKGLRFPEYVPSEVEILLGISDDIARWSEWSPVSRAGADAGDRPRRAVQPIATVGQFEMNPAALSPPSEAFAGPMPPLVRRPALTSAATAAADVKRLRSPEETASSLQTAGWTSQIGL